MLYKCAEQHECLGSAFQAATKSAQDSISKLQSDAGTFFDNEANAWGSVQKTHDMHAETLSSSAQKIHADASSLSDNVASHMVNIEKQHASYVSAYASKAESAASALNDGKIKFEADCNEAQNVSIQMNAGAVDCVSEQATTLSVWCDDTSAGLEQQRVDVNTFAQAHSSAADSMVSECDTFFTKRSPWMCQLE